MTTGEFRKWTLVWIILGPVAVLLAGCQPSPPPQTWIGWEQVTDADYRVTWHVAEGYPTYEACAKWRAGMETFYTTDPTWVNGKSTLTPPREYNSPFSRDEKRGVMTSFLCFPSTFTPKGY